MATYVNDLRLKEIATGDESGTWGTSTNTNLELIAEAFSFGTEAITTNADTHTTTIADGSTDPGRSIYLKYTGTLDSACTITIGPNTVSKLWFIENGTSGSQNIIISQGSGANVTVPAGEVKAIYSDGAGSGAAMVDAFAGLKVSDAAQTNITSLGTLTTLTVDDITIDSSTISDSGDLTLDIGGDIILDADGGNVTFKDGGTAIGDLVNSSSDFVIESKVQDKDIIFKGDDGGSGITALTLDMSDAGTAIFNNKVGIGETSPLGKIHSKVSDTSASASAQGNLLVLEDTENGLSILSSTSGAGYINFGDSDDNDIGMIIYDHSANAMRFWTNAAERMRIDTNGNVGIGDTSPHSFGTNQSGLTISDGTGGCIRLKNDAGSVNFDIENGGGAGVKLNSVNAFPLIFATSDTERIRIDSSGNVLIGATSTNTGGFGSVSPQLLVAGTMPQVALHETDNDKDGYIGIQGSVMFIQTADAIPMRFATSDTERMRIASNGSIGMGTTPPTDTHTGWTQLFIGQKGSIISENDTGVHGLDGTFVTDNMYVDSDTGAFAYIEANESSAYRQEAGNHQFFTQASGSAGAAVTLSEKMRITSAGKVGIGESAPANAKLEILQAGDHDAHSTHGIAIHSTGNTNFTSMYMGAEDGIDSAYIQAVALDGSFTSKNLLLNANGGKVGIGINAPTKTLQIESGSTDNDGLFLSHSSGTIYAKLAINDPGTDNDTLFGSVSNNGLRFQTNNTTRMTLKSDGKLAINTTGLNNSFVSTGIDIDAGTGVGITINRGSDGDIITFKKDNGSGIVGGISITSTSTAFNTSSDYRLKENVDYTWDATTRLKQLKPARFNFIIDETNTLVDGFLAHEVSGIVPEAITGEKDAVDGEGNPQYQGIDQSKLVPLLVKTIQELEARITALES